MDSENRELILEEKIDMNDFLREVLEYATKMHAGQTRDDGSPYIEHPKRVCALVDEYKAHNSKNRNILLAAALLHDTIEDTYASYREIREKFGEEVASLVMEVTTASYVPKLKGKAQYLSEKMLNMTSYALVIKLADRLDNLSDLRGCSREKIERTVKDTIFIIENVERYYPRITVTQNELIDAIKYRINEINLFYSFDNTLTMQK